jgi:predicted phage terminase large subunit-like protein
LTNFDEQLKEVLRIGAKDNFVLFCYYYDFEFFKSRPFLKQIAQAFQDVADGKILTLAVSLPPRAGKSYITTLYCAWLLGKYPTESVMRNTCTATLSRKLSYDAREVLKSEKFASVFPKVKLSDDKAAVDGWNTNLSKNVGYFGQGVGGTIIGFGASKVAITDDLFRSMEDAMSETIKDKVHSWKQATHDSRKETGCAEIDIGTRWTRDDVIGKQSADGYYDREIVISALDEQGNSFCEAVMTTEEYHKKRDKISEQIWKAEYMQQPIDMEGRLFENLKRFDPTLLDLSKSDGAFVYVDVADEGSDYLAAAIGHLFVDKVYVTETIYSKANSDITIPMVVEMINRNKAAIAMFETNSMGAMYLKEVKKHVTDTKVIGINNTQNKATRIFMQSAFILNNFYFTPENTPFIDSLKDYSHEGKNKNDDAPDCIAGLSSLFRIKFKHLW